MRSVVVFSTSDEFQLKIRKFNENEEVKNHLGISFISMLLFKPLPTNNTNVDGFILVTDFHLTTLVLVYKHTYKYNFTNIGSFIRLSCNH